VLLIVTVRLRPLFSVTNLGSDPCFADSPHGNTVNSSFEAMASTFLGSHCFDSHLCEYLEKLRLAKREGLTQNLKW